MEAWFVTFGMIYGASANKIDEAWKHWLAMSHQNKSAAEVEKELGEAYRKAGVIVTKYRT